MPKPSTSPLPPVGPANGGRVHGMDPGRRSSVGAPSHTSHALAGLYEFHHDAADEKLLQVGDLAKATGKTVRAIHHYEGIGLLRPHARSKGRYRLYGANAITRIRWISKMHDLGLSLTQIQQMVEGWESATSAPGAMAAMRRVYVQKLNETRAQITHLETLQRELVASIGYFDTCDTCDPAELVAACASCNHHGPTQKPPELVRGLHSTAPPLPRE